ncbi:MAG: MATE family efflux transporter [Gemmatimonadaceae bacterium]|nr:MATE family efflux transporter [Gemmatimonadaceae bacterium]
MARLAAPIVLVNLGMHGMGLVDAAMLGRVSAADLAAGGLGNFYFFGVAIIGIGILMALDPVIAQGVGAEDEAQIARGIQRGVLMTALISVVVSLSFLAARPVFSALRQPAEVVPLAAGYVLWSIPGMLPFFAFNMLRQTLQAFHRVWPVVLCVVAGNLANVFLNWVLIFGHLGFEPGGVIGSSQGTAIARWVMALVLLAASWRELRPYLTAWRPESWRWGPLSRMFRLGFPIGLQFLAEAGAFGFATVMSGWLGTIVLAGHEITLALAGMTFMVPMGVAAAGSVMVGRAIGRGDVAASRRDAVAALVVGVGFMVSTAIVFAIVPNGLAGLFTVDAATRQLAALLIPIAAVFQVFDGTQVISASILRGAGDTRVPAILHALSFWAVGVPLGAWLAFGRGMGAAGIWWGLTAGLSAAAILQLQRVRRKLGREVARVIIDHAHAP